MNTNEKISDAETMNFSTVINSTKEKVWEILWNHESYRAWTSVFSQDSHAVSDWNEGSKIHFLDGKGNGMYSIISKKIAPVQMTFEHIGEIKDNQEQADNEKTPGWSGAKESYTLNDADGKTELKVELDSISEFADYFKETFPKALQKIKEMAESKTQITVKKQVNVPVEKAWELWTQPEHIKQWNNASPDWHTPRADNNLEKGGKFNFRMEARDGSFGFDFSGVYDLIEKYRLIEYTIDDGRKVKISFKTENDITEITETFEAENENSIELQRTGWQAILDNFKNYAGKI